MEGRLESPGEQLLRRFYAWEYRGRGWDLYPYRVELEPPFRPFLFHYFTPEPAVDDGRRKTFLSSLFAPGPPPPLPAPAFEPEEPLPEPAADDGGRAEFRVLLPAAFDLSAAASQQLLASLGGLAGPVGFELVATAEEVALLLTCPEDEAIHLCQQLAAFAPEAELAEENGYLASRWRRGEPSWVAEFGLAHEFMLPLKPLGAFGADPLTPLVGLSSGLVVGQTVVLQVLFSAAVWPWGPSMLRAVTDNEGGPLFSNAPELVSAAKQKASKPLFASLVRAGVQGRTREEGLDLLSRIARVLSQFDLPFGNELVALDNGDFGEREHEADLLARTTHRTGMILNAEELAVLVHLPAPAVRHPKFTRHSGRTRGLPAIARGGGVILGENRHLGHSHAAALPAEQRLRHTYVIGASGTGKSTLLLNLIVQDIARGEGVAVLDPHGDLVDAVLARVPEERAGDVVLFDPADAERPVGFNILSAHSELERQLLASDLVAVFRRLSTSWGDQMNSVLANAILAFLESERGGTLSDLRRFLVDGAYRSEFLRGVGDPEVSYYWRKEFPLLSGRPQAPILTRLDAFLRPRLIRGVVAQRENRLDFAAIMDGGRIFLAKLSQGLIGEENSHLLGSLLVAKLHQMALARQREDSRARRPFFLYLDEFHNFATPSMATLLSGVRKYGIGLVLAHQDLEQLSGRDRELASAVLANCATRVCFRVSEADARKLAEGFASFEARDLLNLGTGEAICRIERAEFDFNLRTLEPEEVDPGLGAARRRAVAEASRERYGTPASEPVPGPSSEPGAALAPPERVKGPPGTSVSVTASPATARRGRGGQQHKYLQSLLKRLGEERGFRVATEKTVLGGHGHVDVFLERNGLAVGCEISVSTGTRQELNNLSKCLAAGVDYAVLVSSEERVLRNAERRFAAELSPEQRRVRFLTPDAFIPWLDGVRAEAHARSVDAGRRTEAGVSSRSRGRQEAAPPPAPLALPAEGKRMLDARQAAAYVRRAPQTLAKLRCIGGGPAFYKIGRNVFYERSDLDAWLDGLRRRSTSDAAVE